MFGTTLPSEPVGCTQSTLKESRPVVSAGCQVSFSLPHQMLYGLIIDTML